MKTAVFVGSFAPLHNGHLDVIVRASKIFDKVILAITQNTNKPTVASILDREQILKIACKDIPTVEVKSFTGTLADFCKQNKVDCIIKSVRNTIDFEYEYDMAVVNKDLFGVETLVMFSAPKYRAISSSLVREFLRYDKDISSLVPTEIEKKIKEVF